MIQKDLLFSKKAVIYPVNSDRRSHNNDDATKRTDYKIEGREDKFAVQIDSKYVYRIPLKYFCDLGKINFPTKIDLKICCMLETKIKILFELKKKVTAISLADAQIVFLKAPFIQYEQMLLSKSFKQYLETIMLLSKVLRMGIQKTPYQKTYEFQRRSQEFMEDFKSSEKQFDWLKISLVYDKSDKHLTIYDSYNAKCAAKMIKSIKLANISDTYSTTSTMKCDTSNDTQKHMLWKQYVA